MDLEEFFKAPSQESIDKAWLRQLCYDGQMADEEIDEFVDAVYQWKYGEPQEVSSGATTTEAEKDKITYDVESSFVTEDEDKEYPEQVVIFADFGEELGSRTIIHFDSISEMPKFKELIDFLNDPMY